MDNRPIGIFDSGLGGLTAVKETVRRLPGENIIFFGDTGRVPYGTRSAPTIIRYALEDMRFLKRFDIKAAVVACGTVSTTALPQLRENFSLPIYGVTEAAVAAAVRETRSGRIGVIGTNASIRSGTYERLLRQRLPDAAVISRPCPLLVPLVEDGRFDPEDPVVRLLLCEYLTPILEFGADTLILGCTHYPLLRAAVSAVCGNGVTLIDPGRETAEVLARELAADGLAADPGRRGSVSCYVSDDAQSFSRFGGMFLGADITATVSLCDIFDETAAKHEG
ncbi:MAG: glutamate racemase [Clostridia bacterium]|nr:glutamate racemase [Clostridia bacterium]